MVFNPQGSVRLDAPCAPQKLDATPVLRQDVVRLNPFRISNIKKRKPSPIESGEPDVTMLHSRQKRRIEVLRKRLGNTPFRREAYVVKWLDEWKTENVNAPPTYPRGNSAAGG
jgi:hypothetical protein